MEECSGFYMGIIMGRKSKRVKLLVTCERSNLDNKAQTGEIMVYLGDDRISKLCFTIDHDQITVSTFNTEAEYQRCGYGSIAMEVIFGLSRILRLPVVLYSSVKAVGFYQKLGFHRAKENYWKAIKPDDEIDDEDMIWVPQCLNRRRRIIIHV